MIFKPVNCFLGFISGVILSFLSIIILSRVLGSMIDKKNRFWLFIYLIKIITVALLIYLLCMYLKINLVFFALGWFIYMIWKVLNISR